MTTDNNDKHQADTPTGSTTAASTPAGKASIGGKAPSVKTKAPVKPALSKTKVAAKATTKSIQAPTVLAANAVDTSQPLQKKMAQPKTAIKQGTASAAKNTSTSAKKTASSAISAVTASTATSIQSAVEPEAIPAPAMSVISGVSDTPALPVTEQTAIQRSSTTNVRKRNPKPLPPKLQFWSTRLSHYSRLMRLDKPIGTLLLLWPTLWSLWLAARGIPRWDVLFIFSLGVLVMRSAGCVINDVADRKIDGKVMRTRERPLATGAVSTREALVLFAVLCLSAFILVLFTNPLTIKLSVGGLLLAASYPFMKRHTHLPQVVLGAAFAWGIPMAFTAQTGELKQDMWLIYLAVVLWTVVYDTFYAMVDRAEDLKIGVKSTAILFGEQDRLITGALQLMTLYALMLVGQRFELGISFKLSLVVAAGLFAYQQWLIRFRERSACFKAFLNNNWVGAVIFAGIAIDLALKTQQ